MADLEKRIPTLTGRFALAVVAVAAIVASASWLGTHEYQRAVAGAKLAPTPGAANPWTVHGVLRIAGLQKPDRLGPMLGELYIDTDLSMLWAGYLLDWSDKDRFVPDLATEVPTRANGGISADGRTVVYHLRRGVRWQDGAPFTAADVVFSWRECMNPHNATLSARTGYDEVASIGTPDDHTVVVHLKRRFAPFVGSFFTISSEPEPIMPKHLLARFGSLDHTPYNALPIGTGPFRAVYDVGGTIRFVANKHYWRGAPRLAEVDYQWLPDDRALVDALRAHSIDLYMEGAQALEPELQGNRGFTVYLYPFTRFMDVGLNTTRPQLQDRRVRQALAYATNRRRLVDQIANGVNLPATSDQPEFGWAHSDDVRIYPYQPKRAAAMLDAAGWSVGPDGIRRKGGAVFRLLLVGESGSATKEKAAEEIRREWRAVGVDVIVKNYDSDKLYAPQQLGGVQQNGRFDVTFEEWGYGIDPDDSEVFGCAMRPPVGWNIYNYCSPALEAAEARALGNVDLAARRTAYADIQRIIAEDVPMIPIWFDQLQDVANIDLENYRPTHAGSSFWNSYDWAI